VRRLPPNGRVAMFAPRCCSSSHVSLRVSSPALRRRRALWARVALRLRGVWQPSPGWAWQVGQGRWRQPRAKCSSAVGGHVLRNVRSRQRASGQARDVGHGSCSHNRRSATRAPCPPRARRLPALRFGAAPPAGRSRITEPVASAAGAAAEAGWPAGERAVTADPRSGWRYTTGVGSTTRPRHHRSNDSTMTIAALAPSPPERPAKPSTRKLAFRADAAGAFLRSSSGSVF